MSTKKKNEKLVKKEEKIIKQVSLPAVKKESAVKIEPAVKKEPENVEKETIPEEDPCPEEKETRKKCERKDEIIQKTTSVVEDSKVTEPSISSELQKLEKFFAEFDAKLEEAGSKLVVVDFFATWCGPCKVISPKLDELCNELGEKVMIIKVDVDECEELAAAYEISAMPTFVFIKNKETLETFSGANYDKLKQTIEKHLSS